MTNNESDVVAEIRRLFCDKGKSMYGGESVTQLEHALQAAHLAEKQGASPATIVAALLHDIGHLLHDLAEDAPEQGVDDVHEQLANQWLTKHFPPEVTEPIRLHVDAKRYLCTIEPAYLDRLSEPSMRSYKLQGGKLSDQQTQAFKQHDLLDEIVQVRRFDDCAKVQDKATPGLEHFLQYVEQCVTDTQSARTT